MGFCPEGWWDNVDDLDSTDTCTLFYDILLLASLSVTGAPNLVCKSWNSCALASCSYCCDAESVPGSVLSRSSALSHHPSGQKLHEATRDSRQNALHTASYTQPAKEGGVILGAGVARQLSWSKRVSHHKRFLSFDNLRKLHNTLGYSLGCHNPCGVFL